MSKTCTINEIYDITAAFITDRNTTVDATCSDDSMMFKFTKRGLAEYPYQLIVYVPRGAPQRAKFSPYETDKKQGEIKLQRGTGANLTGGRTIACAETKHNVGRAIDKNQCQIVQIGTRMLSPKFFELVEMANKRALNQIATSDNTTQMFNWLYRAQNENQK